MLNKNIYNEKPTYSLYSKQDFKTLTEHIKYKKLVCNGQKTYYKDINFYIIHISAKHKDKNILYEEYVKGKYSNVHFL